MPMEAQWERINTPLRTLTPRERNTGLVLGGLTVLAIALILILNVGKAPAPLAPGCIDATVPWIMGGEHIVRCGKRAEQLCATEAGQDSGRGRGILEACREAGMLS